MVRSETAFIQKAASVSITAPVSRPVLTLSTLNEASGPSMAHGKQPLAAVALSRLVMTRSRHPLTTIRKQAFQLVLSFVNHRVGENCLHIVKMFERV